MKCTIYLPEVESTEQVINEGWIPCFHGGHQQHGPACPSCSKQFLFQGKERDGEIEVKPEHQGKMTYADGDYADKNDVCVTDNEKILVGIVVPAYDDETN